MIKTKFQTFVIKLVEETNNGNIDWESIVEDDSSYMAKFENSLEPNLKIQISSINMGNTRTAILKISRFDSEMNIHLAPNGGELDKLIVSLFDSVYGRKLNSGIAMLQDNGMGEDKSDIMDIFKLKEETKINYKQFGIALFGNEVQETETKDTIFDVGEMDAVVMDKIIKLWNDYKDVDRCLGNNGVVRRYLMDSVACTKTQMDMVVHSLYDYHNKINGILE